MRWFLEVKTFVLLSALAGCLPLEIADTVVRAVEPSREGQERRDNADANQAAERKRQRENEEIRQTGERLRAEEESACATRDRTRPRCRKQ